MYTTAGTCVHPEDPSGSLPGRSASVDGSTKPIGAEYLAGPWPRTAESSDHHPGGLQGALLTGSHTVTARGGVYGAGVAESHGISNIEPEFTYNVEVQPGG